MLFPRLKPWSKKGSIRLSDEGRETGNVRVDAPYTMKMHMALILLAFGILAPTALLIRVWSAAWIYVHSKENPEGLSLLDAWS